MDFCLSPDCELSGLGCDNMTVILVCLLQGDTPEEYIARVSRPAPTPPMEDPVRMCTETGELVAPDEAYATPSESSMTENVEGIGMLLVCCLINVPIF